MASFVNSTVNILKNLNTDFIDFPDACKILILNNCRETDITNHTFLEITSETLKTCLNMSRHDKTCFMNIAATMARVELDTEKLENGQLRFAKVEMSNGTTQFVDRLVVEKVYDLVSCSYCGHTWDGFAQHDCLIKNLMDYDSFVSQPLPTPTQ
jgi:hypothetical protein